MAIIKMNGKLYDAGNLLDLLIKKHNGLIVLVTKKHNSLVDRVIVLENDFKKLNTSFVKLKLKVGLMDNFIQKILILKTTGLADLFKKEKKPIDATSKTFERLK